MGNMLKEIFVHAIKNRDEILSIIKDEKYKNITQKALENWVFYNPKKTKKILYGIDSSFHARKFQGLELWVIDAVSINIKSETCARLFEMGLSRTNTRASQESSLKEIVACAKSIDLSDYVLMDGSLYSHYSTRHTPLTEMEKVISKKNNVIFISKTSNSNAQFKKFGSQAADIFYFTHASQKPGYSKLVVERSHGIEHPITISYVRLNENVPLMKIELFGDKFTNKDIENIMDALSFESVGGYPRCLTMAHNECKISSTDLNRLVSLFSLSNEIGSRDLLE